MDPFVVVAILTAVAAAAMALEQVAVIRQIRAYELAARTSRDHEQYQKTLTAQLLKQIRDLENRITAKDLQSFQMLRATEEPPGPLAGLGRSDEEEALLYKIRTGQER
jgi:hypothetical protein